MEFIGVAILTLVPLVSKKEVVETAPDIYNNSLKQDMAIWMDSLPAKRLTFKTGDAVEMVSIHIKLEPLNSISTLDSVALICKVENDLSRYKLLLAMIFGRSDLVAEMVLTEINRKDILSGCLSWSNEV